MWYNTLMAAILRSPLHGLLSKQMMLISFTGRKSGTRYTIPVTYVRSDDTIHVVSFRERRWWRNLRGGAPVTLRLRGTDVMGHGDLIEEQNAVAEALTAYLRRVPHFARYFRVGLGPDGQPVPTDIAQAATRHVMIRVTLPT